MLASSQVLSSTPRTGAERPCPRSSGRAQEAAAEAAASSGRRHQQQKTTRQRQLHYSYTHIHPMSHFTEERKPGRILRNKSWTKRARDRPQTICERELANEESSQALPHEFFFFLSHTLREGGACPGLESRGGGRASNMNYKPKYPNLPAYRD